MPNLSIVPINCCTIVFHTVFLWLLLPPRYSFRRQLVQSFLSFLCCFCIYIASLLYFGPSASAVMMPLTCVAPCMLFVYLLSSARDGRPICLNCLLFGSELLYYCTARSLWHILLPAFSLPFVPVFIANAALLCTILFLRKRILAAFRFQHPCWNLLGLFSVIFCILLLVMLFPFFNYPAVPFDVPVELFSCLLLMSCLYTLMRLVGSLLAESEAHARRRWEAEHNAQLLEMARRHCSELEKSRVSLQILRHDMLHHDRLAAQLLAENDPQAAAQYLTGNLQELRRIDLKRFCENHLCNLTLSWYAFQAEKSGVTFVCHAAVPEKILCEAEFSVLLSNALQNALDACAYVPQGMIQVSLCTYGNDVLLRIQNSCDGTLRGSGDDIVSRKEGPEHGFGLKSIRATVQKYHGQCSTKLENHLFTLTVSLKDVLPAEPSPDDASMPCDETVSSDTARLQKR